MSASAQPLENLYFSVPGITCTACKQSVENAAKALPWIKSAEVDTIKKRLRIQTKTKAIDIAKLKESCEDAGYPLVDIDQETEKLAEQIRSYWYKALLAGTVGLSLFIFCALGYIIPILGMYILAPCCTLILFYVGYDVFLKAFKEFWSMQFFTMNSLFAVSTLSLLAISIISLCIPALGLPLFFDAAPMIFFFFYLGKIIQERANKIASQKNLRSLAPTKSRLITGKDEKETLTKNLKIGDRILVKKGEIVPVNCRIIKLLGSGLTNHQANDNTDTGNQLKELKEEDLLSAGATISEGDVLLEVSAIEKESQLAKLDQALKQQLEPLDRKTTTNEKTNIEAVISHKIRYFVPIIFLLALITGLIIGFLFTPLLGIQIGLSVLVAICPCMLGLIAPLAIKAAEQKAENYKLVIQQAIALEIIIRTTLFVFDLNGTLTTGKYSVDEKKSSRNHKILKFFYHAEKKSDHPVAKTICTFIKHNHPEIEQEEKESQETHQVGNEHQIKRMGVTEETLRRYKLSHELEKQPGQIIFLVQTHAAEKEIIGHMVLKDTLRPEAHGVIQKLLAKGIQVKVFTGSDESHALPLVEELGLTKDDLQANCSNDEKNIGGAKNQYVARLEQEGHRVAVVVDQINDILAIRSEDPKVKRLSIAVNSANSYIKDRTQVVIGPGGSLNSIFSLFDLSQQFTAHIEYNLAFYFVCSLIAVAIPLVLLLAFSFVLNPAWVAGLVVLQSVLVLANVARFYYKKLPKVESNLDELMQKDLSKESSKSVEFIPPLADQVPISYTRSSAKKPSPTLAMLASREKVVVGEGETYASNGFVRR